jgi:hypothetical protein
MATMTSCAWIGQAHPYQDGLAHVTHHMCLYENSRAVWIIKAVDSQETQQEIRWVPRRPETIFEEGLLLIGLFVLKNAKLRVQAQQIIGSLDETFFDLNVMNLDVQPLIELNRTLNQSATYDFKLIMSIFDSSSLFQKETLLKNYINWTYEVCVSLGSNHKSPFQNK